MSALISIIVPCYNQAQYLDECLQSVLDQTYHDWECIIVNDGSPDNTEEVALRWVGMDSRFKFISQDNKGVSAARNLGIEKSEGTWILPLDADDKISDRYLEFAQNLFIEDYTVIYCQAEFFGNIISPWILREYSYEVILFENHIFCTAFFKKSVWQAASGYDENLLHGKEDWDFWLSILDENCRVIRLDYVGFFYRRKEVSRDVLINSNIELSDDVDKYIYIKHLNKYLLYNKNAILNSRYYFKIENENTKMKEFLEKNALAIRILKKLRILK